MYTLVVVDMQANFPASLNEKTQKACKAAIKKAIKNKSPIVFLEYDDYGPTLPALTKLTRDYVKAYHVAKSGWDGSSETLQTLKALNIESSKFRVCGVYTDCCVSATALGLVDKVPTSKVEVIENACWATDDSCHNRGLKKMTNYKSRIRVIK